MEMMPVKTLTQDRGLCYTAFGTKSLLLSHATARGARGVLLLALCWLRSAREGGDAALQACCLDCQPGAIMSVSR